MIISNIVLSYPYIKYKVNVKYYTERKSTAIEWIILEAIKKCEEFSKYAEISIEMFFEQIFGIYDVDSLIKPTLFMLYDLGAINLFGIDNETELKTVPMGNLRLTQKGSEMQSKGLLPGEMKEDNFNIIYDVYNNDLSRTLKSNSKQSTGTEVVNNVEEECNFPAFKVKEWLVEEKLKNNRELPWLLPTTTIEDISEVEYEIKWKNVQHRINLDNNFIWSIAGVQDDILSEKILKNFGMDCSKIKNDILPVEFNNLEDTIDKIIDISEIYSVLAKYLKKDKMCAINYKYCEQQRVEQLMNRTNVCVILAGSNFEIEENGSTIIIKLPRQNEEINVLDDSIIYCNKESSIYIGRIPVRTSDYKKELVMAYKPKPEENKINLEEFFVNIVKKHYKADNRVLFILIELGMKEKFLEYISKIILDFSNVREKADFIKKINVLSGKIYNRKVILPKEEKNFLIDESYIAAKSGNIENTLEIIYEYGDINEIRYNRKTFQEIARITFQNINKEYEIKKIWMLWDEIEKIDRKLLNYINKKNLYKNVYSSKSILSLLNLFGTENFIKIEQYTPVEQILVSMRRIINETQKTIKNTDVNILKSNSNEKIMKAILYNREELELLYDQSQQWKDLMDEFNLKIIDIQDIEKAEVDFVNAIKTMKQVSDSIAIFFDDPFRKYNEVYIVDTCALLNEPELISWFEDDNALLVIPIVVLNELNFLKEKKDQQEAFLAREVIRNIESYRDTDCSWLDLGEDSYPELLPQDLESKKPDNKILSIAIKHTCKKPIIVTDDINFGNIAFSQKVKTIDSSALKNAKEHNFGQNRKNERK